jgi:hypothetical protein
MTHRIPLLIMCMCVIALVLAVSRVVGRRVMAKKILTLMSSSFFICYFYN